MKTYVKDIDKDEIRSGFLVTTDRKKIWNKEIELLMEVDRICKKYDIKYFAVDGTMLGCARHNGFIPWDDDIDVAMMRPDYMQFIEVAPKEIKDSYFLQNAYTDTRIMNWSKLMDETTSAIEDWEAYDTHQGVFVDVFPLDIVSDVTERSSIIDDMIKELWMCVIMPHKVAELLTCNTNTHVALKTLKRIIDMPLAERMSIYEDFCVKHFSESSKVAIQTAYWCDRAKPVDKNLFKQTKYMPFEQTQIPMLEQFEYYLDGKYNNWRTPVKSPNLHEGIFMSVDIPYDFMMKNINRDLLRTVEPSW